MRSWVAGGWPYCGVEEVLGVVGTLDDGCPTRVY